MKKTICLILSLTAFIYNGSAEVIRINGWQYSLSQVASNVNKGIRDYAGDTIIIDRDWYSESIKEPIGTKENPFRGVFLGQGAKISLDFNDRNIQHIGIFGYVQNAVISSVRSGGTALSSFKPNKGEEGFAGTIVGYAENSIIKNCLIEGGINEFKFASQYKELNQNYICGGKDEESIIRQNYVLNQDNHIHKTTCGEAGHDTFNGEDITNGEYQTFPENDIFQSTVQQYRVPIYMDERKNMTLDLTTVSNHQRGIFYSLGCEVKKLIINPRVQIIGEIKADIVEIHDGCYFENVSITDSKEIIYHRTFDNFTEYKQGGWQSICLPFDAKMYADGILKQPVLKGKSGQFWLRKFIPEKSYNDAVCFESLTVDELQANDGFIPKNTPFLIALPGQSYGSMSLFANGDKITFRGRGSIEALSSRHPIGDNSDYIFMGSLVDTPKKEHYILNNTSESNEDVDADNVKGTHFYETSNNSVKPFRAHLEKSNPYYAPRQLKIVDSSYLPSSLSLTSDDAPTITAYGSNGNIFLRVDQACTADIVCAVSGRTVHQVPLYPETSEIVEGLPKGVYIVGGRKVIL